MIRAALADDPALRVLLRRVHTAALTMYLSGEGGPRGCYTIGTAATQAAVDPAVREFLAEGVRSFDEFLARRIGLARERGEIPGAADPAALAYLASATLHTLAIRARAGVSRQELDALADAAIAVVCAPGR